ALARRAEVLARRAGKASRSWFGSGLCATRSPGRRNARAWRAGVALATVVCAARRKACVTRERDAYL
ncbi:hypothetical protein A2U01_0114335, partial [Trifolium medium]|nr:hypothetical protein [Trifolium medium]